MTGCSAADSSDGTSAQKITSKNESSPVSTVTEDSSVAASSEKDDEPYTNIGVDPYELEKMGADPDGGDYEDWQDFEQIGQLRRSVWGKFYAEKTGLDITEITPDIADNPDIEEGSATAYLSFCRCGYKYNGIVYNLEISTAKYDSIQSLYDNYFGDDESIGLKGGKTYIDKDVIVDEFDEYENGYLIMALSKNGLGLSVYTSSKTATLDDMKKFLTALDF
ncbi:MAG: hypothetical protein IJ740_16015 [Ruminococcus sp.]|nr:hypothetical protein [Ruminococcus sp.]